METIYKVKGTFNGLYEWGKGWDYATKNKWDEFWRNSKGIFWKFFQSGESQYLVSLNGSIVLHPLNFNEILHSYSNLDCELRELRELCKKCAEICGGSFDMEVKTKKIEF